MGDTYEVEEVLDEEQARVLAKELFLAGEPRIKVICKAVMVPMDKLKIWRVEDQWDKSALQQSVQDTAIDLKKFGYEPKKAYTKFFKMSTDIQNQIENNIKNQNLTRLELKDYISMMKDLHAFNRELIDSMPDVLLNQAQLDRAGQLDKDDKRG